MVKHARKVAENYFWCDLVALIIWYPVILCLFVKSSDNAIIYVELFRVEAKGQKYEFIALDAVSFF